MSHDGHTPDINVAKVARLARLEIEPADIGPLTQELASILSHARDLGTLDLTGVEPLSHAADLHAALAEDLAHGELPRSSLEAIAPRMDGPYIAVPKVLGGEAGGA